MEQNERDLLLKDLCARLPYGVICKDDYARVEGKLVQIGINYDMCLLSDDYGETEFAYIPNCEPYLFPISNMSEDLINELYTNITELELKAINDEIEHSVVIAFEIDFYHKHHIDYRGLIHMGLAIDATDKNIY